VDTYGTGALTDEEIGAAVKQVFNLTPKGLIQALKLKRPIYRKTTNYGHFGRKLDEFVWEKTDRAGALRRAAGVK
jgi:S-adenosylmethionine synthetase